MDLTHDNTCKFTRSKSAPDEAKLSDSEMSLSWPGEQSSIALNGHIRVCPYWQNVFKNPSLRLSVFARDIFQKVEL